MEGKHKMMFLEVTQSHDEDLREVKKFTEKFLVESLKSKASGDVLT
jgi:hypothetical protein